MIQSLFNTGLLKNNFANPNLVGIIRIPERQIPSVYFIPGKQFSTNVKKISILFFTFQKMFLYLHTKNINK